MRLIDADALCRRLQKRLGSPEGDGKLMEVNYEITRAPTLTGGPRNPTEARVMKAFRAYLDKACKDQTIHDPTPGRCSRRGGTLTGEKGGVRDGIRPG